MELYNYRKLIVYVKAKALAIEVYGLLRKYPKEENYALCDQMRRAAISITSNIAEGSSRYSVKEKCHFLEIAYGSLMELMSQLEISNDLNYILDDDLNNIEVLVSDVARLLSGLQRSYQNDPVSQPMAEQ